MSLDAGPLLDRMRPTLARLTADLTTQVEDPGIASALRAEHAREVEARRTADPYEVWVAFRITQIGAAWMLSLLFVRTLEDRGLLPPRLKGGADHRAQLRALAPYLDDRDYLRVVFRELTRYRGVRDVFDAAHNPVWLVGPSPEMAAELLSFSGSEAGLGGFDFTGDTRFLGDVYEQLDEGVRERFALLQTPDFVEAFILDQTLTPALAARGVEGLTLIDPTCGSGHFLLGAFERLRAAWAKREPGTDTETWAFKAVHQVYGADINPYAVAIARFRLVLAYLKAAECASLSEARDLRLNVAVADSLLPVEGAEQPELASTLPSGARDGWHVNPFSFAQSAEAEQVLGKTFDVVVGNPPYITVQDPVLREEYREQYPSASGKYQLVVPFIERLFRMANDSGWVGAIVGNAFMKRSFGKKLIENFLTEVDLASVVDTSGAYIPGHGTPTIILFGRHRTPTTKQIVAVMGKRGEPSTPKDPANGLVWSGIRDHHDAVGFENDYISVESVQRTLLASHPWSLKGGGAVALKSVIEGNAPRRLGKLASAVGFMGISAEDDIFIAPPAIWSRRGGTSQLVHPIVLGEHVRNWGLSRGDDCWFPYGAEGELVVAGEAVYSWLWTFRERLWNRRAFGNQTYKTKGKAWYSWHQVGRDKLEAPLTIAFAEVATHNHYVLDRGGRVFKQTAPVIKLPADATEGDHLALLGYLNSSVACFWLKQVMMVKTQVTGMDKDPWRLRVQFDATKTKMLPLPQGWRSDRAARHTARKLDQLAARRQGLTPSHIVGGEYWSTADELTLAFQAAQSEDVELLNSMVFLQEELDWHVYRRLGLWDGPCFLDRDDLLLPVGARAFELLLSATLADEEASHAALGGTGPIERWFSIHGWESGVELPDGLPSEYVSAIAGRRKAIAENRDLGLLESPSHKRRWFRPDHDIEPALATWLLDRIEAETQATPTPRSIRQITRALRADPKVNAVAQVYTDQSDPDLEPLFTTLIASESVPYLAALRYKPSGIVKYRAWQATWAAQRREDAGETVEVPLPPTYKSSDFRRADYWRQRGKLDVPKERFIAYPGVEDEDDPTPVIGWAGWDHADRIAALGGLVDAQPTPGRRIPLLAGMHELLPWVLQWHGDDMRYGTPLGAMWRDHLQGMLTAQHLTERDLEAWRPVKATKTRRKRAPKVTVDALVAAFEELTTPDADGVERSALAKALGVSGAAVGKAAQPLLDDGRWVVVKQRPITYALEPDA